jgi:RNA polymerase sigma-70 factor (ECF subfamily)
MRTNEEWLRDLRDGGSRQADALEELREKILRTLRAYLAHSAESKEIAEDCAQDALLMIQGKLGTFRGESRFTTWATMVAIRIVLGELRRRRWKEVSLDQSRTGNDLPAWPIEDAKSLDPEKALQQNEAWRILKSIIENELTSRQRFVLVANVFQGMPLDLVAGKLGTNRDNVYKVIHDARKKLRKSLVERGLSQEEILRIFEVRGKDSR